MYLFAGILSGITSVSPESQDRNACSSIIAYLIISFPGLAAIKKDPPSYTLRIIKNSGSLALLIFLKDIKIIIGTIAKAAGVSQRRDIKYRLSK